MILGIDEAGRGPWAGPLVVGAVVLGGKEIEGLTDSKKLSKKKREIIYDEITLKTSAYASGWVSARELDEIGMSAALRLATRRAVEQITVPYTEIIIDGTVNFLADTGKGKYVKTMPKADLLIPSVSAASIVAKVERDRYMEALDGKYPGYGFKGHAGYGVAKHRAAIEELGVTPEHRLSFAPLSRYAPPQHTVGDAPEQDQPRSRQKTGSSQDAPLSGVPSASTTREIGDSAEDAAASFLQKSGHTILDRNWRTKFCEIDIVSKKNGTIYFTEVKYRKNATHGDGMAMITPKKLKQMHFATRVYVHSKQIDGMNLLLVALSVTGEPPQVADFVTIV